MTATETPTTGLGQLIASNRFEVPSHQRDFSWGTDSVKQFLDDIENAKLRAANIYFCGLMVFTKTDTPVLKVLDGQQRLATTLMIFSAIRNWLHQHPECQRFEFQTETNFLGRPDVGETQVMPKLTLTASNNDMFQKFVVSGATTDEIATALSVADDRNKKLLKAIKYVNDYISKRLDAFTIIEQAESYCRDITKYIANEVSVVSFVLDKDEAAYTIFETLNDRGLALKPLDLVKNYLFSRGEKFRVGGLKEMEERWAEMMALLGSRADSFLRAFWASRHGTMEGTKLFGAFKGAYETPDKMYQVSVDMRGAAERYAALFSASDPVWSQFDDDARNSVEALGIIGASQLYPVILAALERFKKREMERLLRLLEVIAVRYQLVERGRPGRMESLGGQVAREIFANKITTATKVRADLDELYIPDSEFKRKLFSKTEGQSAKARYLIVGIERQSLEREGKTYPAELVPGSVTLEHILPKNSGTNWKAETDADEKLVEDMLYRLGNLCLLTDVNRELGNAPFAEKRKFFARSRLNTTKNVAEYETWGRVQIERRQKHMAELAVTRWRFQ